MNEMNEMNEKADEKKDIKKYIKNPKAKGNFDSCNRDRYSPLSPEDPVDGSLFIDQVLDRFGIDANEPSNQLAMRWHDIVGKEVSQHVFFEKLEGGAVHIACENPSMAAYMKINGNDVIKRISAVFPELEVKKVQVRVSPRRV